MRQVHKAGDKAFVDYAGTVPTIVDAATGEVIAVELFVAEGIGQVMNRYNRKEDTE